MVPIIQRLDRRYRYIKGHAKSMKRNNVYVDMNIRTCYIVIRILKAFDSLQAGIIESRRH